IFAKGRNFEKKRHPWVDAILTKQKSSGFTIRKVRDCHPAFNAFFKNRAKSVGVDSLPVGYQIRMVSHYQISDNDNQAVETYIWLVRRSQGRSTFQP
ncbi:MAG: hypothetical protein KDB00_01525, partial [Planctomycetales bacterium]|nr:hypothetical protein [Planctomycetales bacterium]